MISFLFLISLTVKDINFLGEKFFYERRGKRDPFEAITVVDENDSLLSVGGASLIGIIQKGGNFVALLKDREGKGFILKEGDRVRGGKVVKITEDRVIFFVRELGTSRKVVLQLKNKRGKRK